MRRDAWHVRVNVPTLAYLAAAGGLLLAGLAGARVHWLTVHVLLLGAVTSAILVWSAHFTTSLLVRPVAAGQRALAVRLALANAGILLVLGSPVAGLPRLLDAGAGLIIAAAGWHAVAIGRAMRRPRNPRWRPLIAGYVVAVAYLPVGVVLGVLLAGGLAEPWAPRVLLAHLAANLLGWIGVTVAATLVQLWPTMMRIQLLPGTEEAARRGLPVLYAAPALVVLAALSGSSAAVALALAVEIAGWVILAWPHLADLRRRPPRDFATVSVLASLAWLIASTVLAAAALAGSGGAHAIETALTWGLGVGFAVQIVLGALGFLVPAVLGGGPAAVRSAIAVLERWWQARFVMLNGGLLMALIAPAGPLRAIGTGLVAAAILALVPVIVAAALVNRRVRRLPIPERAPLHEGFTDRYHPPT